MLDLFAVYECFRRMYQGPYMYVSECFRALICMPYMYALYVCVSGAIVVDSARLLRLCWQNGLSVRAYARSASYG